MADGAVRGSRVHMAGLRSGDIERIALECNENRPIHVEAFTYRGPQQAQFDMHYCLELGVVLRGRMERHYGAGSYSCGRGEIWMCGMWEPHGWGTTRTPTECAVIFIHPPLLARLHFPEAREVRWLAPFVAAPDERPRIAAARRAQVIDLTRDIVTSAARSSPLDAVDLHLKTLALLRIILESWGGELPRPKPAVDLEPIGTAMELVFETRGFVPTTRAARLCGLGRNGLSRLFAEYMGISFAEFALRYRVSAAAAELLDTEAPVKAVAADWGFTDASHFFRRFVRYYGCSPSEYRQRGKKAAAAERAGRAATPAPP